MSQFLTLFHPMYPFLPFLPYFAQTKLFFLTMMRLISMGMSSFIMMFPVFFPFLHLINTYRRLYRSISMMSFFLIMIFSMVINMGFLSFLLRLRLRIFVRLLISIVFILILQNSFPIQIFFSFRFFFLKFFIFIRFYGRQFRRRGRRR